MKTKADFQKACQQFVAIQKQDKDIIGIIVTGSYIHGNSSRRKVDGNVGWFSRTD